MPVKEQGVQRIVKLRDDSHVERITYIEYSDNSSKLESDFGSWFITSHNSALKLDYEEDTKRMWGAERTKIIKQRDHSSWCHFVEYINDRLELQTIKTDRIKGFYDPERVERCVCEESERPWYFHLVASSGKCKVGDCMTNPPERKKIRLRSKPKMLSNAEIEAMVLKYNFYTAFNKKGCFVNDLHELNNGVILDKVTCLMWTKNKSKIMSFIEAEKQYIPQLNKKQFGGYSDWRLPTTEELGSLISCSTKMESDVGLKIHLDPVFGEKIGRVYSSDSCHVKIDKDLNITFTNWALSLQSNPLFFETPNNLDNYLERIPPSDRLVSKYLYEAYVIAVRSTKGSEY